MKLDEKITYDENIDILRNIGNEVYLEGKEKKRVVPFGKKWFGDSQKEQNTYFENSIPPRPIGKCNMVNLIRYYDAKIEVYMYVVY